MNSNEILRADVLDILFDNRNKQYGAYILRKNYNRRLGLSLGIGLSMTALFFFLIPQSNSSVSYLEKEKGEVTVRMVDIPATKKMEPVIPKKSTPAPSVKERSHLNPVIMEDDKVKNPMFDQTDLADSRISATNIEGPAMEGEITNVRPTEPSKVKETEKTVVAEPPIQREPEFPGGQHAWVSFLQRNLIAPEELQPGETKTVSIRFFVDTDGSVAGFEVVKSAGRSFDNEVIRVLKRMPKWKPAIQNGLAVKRVFTQPVSFVGVEQ